MITRFVMVAIVALASSEAAAQYMGNYSNNPTLPRVPYPSGTFTNPYGTDSNSPRMYSQDGQFRGNLNSNQYDPNSVANPYGRYGSPYSPDSTRNPYGAGSPYRYDSPTNPYGTGMPVYRPRY